MKNFIKLTSIFLFTLTIAFCVIYCKQDKTQTAQNLMFETPIPQNASDFVANISIGWNLGNTLDTISKDNDLETPVSKMEKAWGNPDTTKDMITKIRTAGFNTIRIPVSWGKAADSNFNIRADWMARVKEIVDYAVDNEMYIILNTHHDEEYFKFTKAEADASKKAFKKVWEQIADSFKDYDERLVFEGLNEPRTKGAQHEWTGGIPEEITILNEHYQIFVDTVRASGGNNDKRILMINTYGASATQRAVNGLKLPVDTIANKLIVSVHAYEPYNFTLNEGEGKVTEWSSKIPSDIFPIMEPINRVYDTFVSKGIPVIMGEFGALKRNSEAVRADWAEYYVKYAKSKGIACIWWDDGGNFRLSNRYSSEFYYPQIYKALLKGIK